MPAESVLAVESGGTAGVLGSSHSGATHCWQASSGTRRVNRAFGILIVIISLTALYPLLNWPTRGYYRGLLTVAVCLSGSGAIVGTNLLVGMLA